MKVNLHHRSPSVPMNDYLTPQKMSMLSPSAVVAGARKDLSLPSRNVASNQFLHTQQHGELAGFTKNLEILSMDRKQNRWVNAEGFGKKKMSGELTVRDIVDNVLRVPAFGFQGYNPKATVKDMLPVEAHR